MSDTDDPEHANGVEVLKKIEKCNDIDELNNLESEIENSMNNLLDILKKHPNHKYQEAYISLIKEILAFKQDKRQKFEIDKEKFNQRVFNIITGIFIFITAVGTFGQFILLLCNCNP